MCKPPRRAREAGIHTPLAVADSLWIPAFAGTTEGKMEVHTNCESLPVYTARMRKPPITL
jgi:hypothetical protein